MNLLKDIPFDRLYVKMVTKSNNAQRQGNSFSLLGLSVMEVLEIIGDGNCAYTGKEFIDINDATFERVNPNLGYVKGNVVMVSREANHHKSQLDAFVKKQDIPDAMKVKLLRKALYQLEKVK